MWNPRPGAYFTSALPTANHEDIKGVDTAPSMDASACDKNVYITMHSEVVNSLYTFVKGNESPQSVSV